MVVLKWVLWALLTAPTIALSPWEAAFNAQPNPQSRDYAGKDYFVAVMTEPTGVPFWTLVEPMPIRDHWLFSVPKGQEKEHGVEKREALSVIYDAKVKKLHKRLPLPPREDEPENTDLLAIEDEFSIHDPLFKSQWHIFNTLEEGNDINVVKAWRRNITGKGVTVAVIDDGLDYTHPDLKDAFSKEGSWDYNDHQNLPEPKLGDDNHGTRCAGEIAAGHNDFCGVGLAPDAKVAGIRILSGALSDADEARAMIHAKDHNWIYSCSWGPSDNGKTVDAPPLIVKRAILEGIENGRQNKGSVYVFAAGNGHSSGDNCNYDGYTNSIYSITVAATDRNNRHPYYGESCSANMISTYSSNSEFYITTCDRVGSREPKDACTDHHSGTSAAAPLAAGVFALVLEQRPELTWRDLQYLCRETGKKFELEPGLEWQTTHDGKHYHNHYGYGHLDADDIVEKAKDWELVGPQSWFIGDKRDAHIPINGTGPFVYNYTVSQEDWDNANLKHVEHVNVVVSVDYPVRGGIKYSLRSPSGFVSVLADRRPNDLTHSPLVDWQFMSVAHWGEQGVGNWSLIIEGMDDKNGTLKDVRLKLWGHALDTSKVKRFSDEWDKYENHIDRKEYTPANEKVSSSEPEASSTAEAEPSSVSQELPEVTPEPTSHEQSPPDTVETQPPTPIVSPPAAASSEAGHDDGDTEKSPHHGISFYLGVTAVGTSILAVIIIPIAYWRMKRTSRFTIDDGDFALIASDVELDDFHDFAISSEGEENDELLEPHNDSPHNIGAESDDERPSENLL